MAGEARDWDPMYPDEVLELLGGLEVPWWLAGGWAIEAFVGRPLRDHGDTDVVIRRDDQLRVQEYLSDWDLHKTKQPGLAPWPRGEILPPGVNDVWCRPAPARPWRLQLMLLETKGDAWIFRRDSGIRGPLAELGRMATSGIRYLRPEVQLLYKARPESIAKDEIDFAAAEPLLVGSERTWLKKCLERRFPSGHRWIDALTVT